MASLAIPASLIASFALIRAAGFTLNSMTLLGLTLAVGIVIDDAIVVLENIFRHMEEEAAPPFQAAIGGTKEVTLAVVATSVSLIVIFLPVAFMTGYTQRFIYPFGFTMAFAVMVSLLVSLTLTPMLSARVVRTDGRVHRHGEGVLGRVDRFYRRSLEWSLDHRAVIVAVSLIVFASTFVLSRMVGRSFLPNEDMGEFQLVIDTPEGTSLQGMERAVIELTPKLLAVPGIAHVMPTIFERVNHSHIQIQLKPIGERASQEVVAQGVRKVMAAYPSYKPTIVMRSPIGGGEIGLVSDPGQPDRHRICGSSRATPCGCSQTCRRCRKSATRRRSSTCRIPNCASPWIDSARRTWASGSRILARRFG